MNDLPRAERIEQALCLLAPVSEPFLRELREEPVSNRRECAAEDCDAFCPTHRVNGPWLALDCLDRRVAILNTAIVPTETA